MHRPGGPYTPCGRQFFILKVYYTALEQLIFNSAGEIKMAEDNTVFVGKKPTMNYVLAVVTQFNSGSKEIVIKARGKAISRAVDVAEIVRNRFISDVRIKDIKIGTESVATEEGPTINVSSIEIFMEK
jgi:DNA-binding protein